MTRNVKIKKKKVWNELKADLEKKTEEIKQRVHRQRSFERGEAAERKKSELAEERKKMKELCNRKKQEWCEGRSRKVRESRNMVEWWEAVGKFRMKRNRTEENISQEQWVQHFSKLLGSKELEMQEEHEKEKKRAEERGEGSIDKELDGEISMEALKQAVRGTKNKKAPRRNNGGIHKGTTSGKKEKSKGNIKPNME